MLRYTASLLFLVLSVQYVSPLCEDAVKNVTVYARQSKNGTTHKYVGVNLYSLETYQVIEILQGNVTELCKGMFASFPNLTVLSLININLSKIQADTFQNVPRLSKLSLAINEIEELVDGSLNNLVQVEILYLSGNRIKVIQSSVFKDLPELKSLHLDRNQLTTLGPALFNSNPLLNTLDLSFNGFDILNGITFPQLQPSHSETLTVYFGNNNIKDVDSEIFTFKNPIRLHLERNILNTMSNLFHGLPEYSKLYLSSNQFNCIPDDVLENMKNSTKTIYLYNNPISCDCLQGIRKTLEHDDTSQDRGELFYNSSFPCDMPSVLSL